MVLRKPSQIFSEFSTASYPLVEKPAGFQRSPVTLPNSTGSLKEANSFKPYQAYLALRQYPLTHDVFILVNDPRNGLPTGLMTFLTKDRGQRIILKSGLVPATQPVRLVNVKDEF